MADKLSLNYNYENNSKLYAFLPTEYDLDRLAGTLRAKHNVAKNIWTLQNFRNSQNDIATG